MTDIVERLRVRRYSRTGDTELITLEAADEIERLREWNAEIALNAREFAAENERLREALEIMSMMGGYTKLHPDETAPGVEQNTYSWGVSDGYKEMADFARAALEGRT